MTDLRYPIGPFKKIATLSSKERANLIMAVGAAPAELRKAVTGLNDEQLDTPYRSGGWTSRQVVHHVVDSHINAYVRFKLALTEDQPTIKPYLESKWAETSEARVGAVEGSLQLLDALHARWVHLLRAMAADHFGRRLNHPEHDEPLTLDDMLQMYAWHGRHHTAHITTLRTRMGWTFR